MENILADFRSALRDNVDEHVRANGDRHFREEVKFYGVGAGVVTKLSKEYFDRVKGLPKGGVFSLCEELWRSGYNEEQWAAANWAYWVADRYEPGDFEVFDRWLNAYVTNWAACDTLCNHAVGTFVEMFPDHVERLKKWARSGNRWVKRGAAVTLIIPARKGLFFEDILEISDILLTDADDLVRKGYGWMLKAAGEVYPHEVFEYVQSKKDVMPRTAFRYALEKLPQELRVRAMEK